MLLGVAVALLGISLSVESANVPDYFQTEPELYPGELSHYSMFLTTEWLSQVLLPQGGLLC